METANGYNVAEILLTLGGLFFIGLIADLLGQRTPVPRVTLLLLAGMFLGQSGIDLIPAFMDQWFPVLTTLALSFVGFLLGQKLTPESLAGLGKPILLMSIFEVLVTSLLIFLVLFLVGFPLEVALIVAGIAPATAPATTVDVVHEMKAKGPFARSLLGIVAIDDAWGLLVFSVLLAIAQSLGHESSAADVLLIGIKDIGGALILGVLLGLPVAYLTGRINPGEPTQAEALGAVMMCAGIAGFLDVSFILSAMVLGAVVANRADHHERAFHAIEGIEWPALILFFLLAGASLDIEALKGVGLLGTLYIIFRSLGLFLGAKLGGKLAGAEPKLQNWMGLALLPQAGVALGMSLVAAQRFPEISNVIIPVVIGSTMLFEVIGPVVTRWVLKKVGEDERDA